MLNESLQTHAAHYVSGAMPPEERESFDVLLAWHAGLRQEVAELQDMAVRVTLAAEPAEATPPPALRDRILQAAADRPVPAPDALVVADRDGLVEWVNGAFTDLCGYSLSELKGRRPGQLLQGADTDSAAVARIRTALRKRRPCRETLVNYHKNGSAYRALIRIAPILDHAGEPLFFVARERRVDA